MLPRQEITGLAPDGGPFYAETDLSILFSEPWNAISSLAIVLPAVYWAVRLKGNYRRYPFIFFCIPLLILGGMGSTLFHAFRNSEYLLMMDVLPTAILMFSVGVYFWLKIIPNWWGTAGIVIPGTILRYAIYEVYSEEVAVNISYFIAGTIVFFPVIFYLVKTKFDKGGFIVLSVLFLILSLVFREMDFRVIHVLPMGSHFLWHIFSGFGAFFLAKYLYYIRIKELTIVQ